MRAAAVPFLAFVLALGMVVRAVTGDRLAAALGHLISGGTGLPALLGIAALAAVLANVINNLPRRSSEAPGAGDPHLSPTAPRSLPDPVHHPAQPEDPVPLFLRPPLTAPKIPMSEGDTVKA